METHQGICDKCPSEKNLIESLQPVVKREVEIKGIRPTPYTGLCEVHVRINGRDNIIYTNPDNGFFIFGHLIESQSGENLTRKALELYTKLSPDEVKSLKSYAAFSIGKGPVEVYYVTDPQCPYCKKGEKILKQLADAGEITVHILLYPLAFHKNAKEQCISIICDKKGLQGLETEYQSENQCTAGKNKVESTILFMKEKGVTGTPGYIFTDGIIHTGLLHESNLRDRLGLPPPKPVEKTPKSNTQTKTKPPKKE
ncbi:MAG: thiol:disulfide interchange protein DsbC [Candidatus Magnetoglobus multicellularis str. Araruama]|uniref:Thiol:disulfide interchange protein DsbC n=1 Tax=Candidatus Magnetoglobus multicellularis str. Araruama TaxID=890399 RepID=A0A1V1NZR0_9BACT|nr:MAG: thiol:disulfide interchange protein DsbC [Candidatus Magnetoglobus multicellularis str. Araruama]